VENKNGYIATSANAKWYGTIAQYTKSILSSTFRKRTKEHYLKKANLHRRIGTHNLRPELLRTLKMETCEKPEG
jgi:hypothetical protein